MVPISPDKCPCDHHQPYVACCGRFLEYKQTPQTAEELMRSRFSAYALGHYQYIIDTYSMKNIEDLNVQQLADDQADVEWKSLQIQGSIVPDQVEFTAYYRYQNRWYIMHERSTFIQQNGQWLYAQGFMFDDSGPFTPQRNQLCPCGSGKKFKKCCMP